MEPSSYTGKEWQELAKAMDARQLRNALKGAYRRQAKEAVKTARGKLRATGMRVEGSRSDWEKGIRSHVYSRGGGFLVTVKGNRGKSMHKNRRGRALPILQWAEEGTRQRYSGPGRRHYEWSRSGRGKPRRTMVRDSGIPRGRMPAFRFLDKAAPEMYRNAEKRLTADVEAAVLRAAKRHGLL